MDRGVYTCEAANNAKFAKNAKFEGGNKKVCDLKENIKDLPFISAVVTEEEAGKWLEEGGY